MSSARTPAGHCPRCSARVRAADPWCTLCHASLGPGPAATSPGAGSPAARPATVVGRPPTAPGGSGAGSGRFVGVPVPRSAPEAAPPAPTTPGRLVGGQLPPDVLAQVDAGLAGLAGAELAVGDGVIAEWAQRVRSRPALAATVGGVGVLVALVVAMTVLGLVI